LKGKHVERRGAMDGSAVPTYSKLQCKACLSGGCQIYGTFYFMSLFIFIFLPACITIRLEYFNDAGFSSDAV